MKTAQPTDCILYWHDRSWCNVDSAAVPIFWETDCLRAAGTGSQLVQNDCVLQVQAVSCYRLTVCCRYRQSVATNCLSVCCRYRQSVATNWLTVCCRYRQFVAPNLWVLLQCITFTLNITAAWTLCLMTVVYDMCVMCVQVWSGQ